MDKPLLLVAPSLLLLPLLMKRNMLRIKKTNALPKHVDAVFSSQGVGITYFEENLSFQSKSFKYQFYLVNTSHIQLDQCFTFQQRCISKNCRLLLSKNREEAALLIEKICYDLSKPKLNKETKTNFFQQQCLSDNIKTLFYSLPVSRTEATILMDVYGNLFNLSQASATNIMSKTPLSKEAAEELEQLFQKR